MTVTGTHQQLYDSLANGMDPVKDDAAADILSCIRARSFSPGLKGLNGNEQDL
jgi:hypothetical protein